MFDNVFAQIGVAALALCSACTAGQVTQNGSPVEGFVLIQTCDPEDVYLTVTLPADGSWSFNPYSATSPDFDPDQYVPEGPILLRVFSGSDEYVEFHQHEYDETCNYTVDNVYGPNPCKLYDVQFDPMTPTEIATLELAHFTACLAP